MNPPNNTQASPNPTEPAKVLAVPPLLLDAKQAAKLLGISRSHFLELHQMGQIPVPVRLGRSVRWRVTELKAWVSAGCPSQERWKLRRTERISRH